MVLAVGTENTEGKTITVDDSGGANYTKIQDAIDAAEDGDTIRVYEGTYYENVVVNKTVSLVGNGSEVTTIDGGGSGDVVKITEDGVNMSGFNVTGSGSSGYPDYDSGIKVESNHSRLFDNNCSNNHYGIRLNSSSDCTLDNNTCNSNNRNGICLRYSSDCIITYNTCNSNNDDGISLDSSSGCTLTYNICSSNNDDGISLDSSSGCTLTSNICENNICGGIYLLKSRGCTIENNTCENNGNGIYLTISSDRNTLTNNTCSNNWHGIRLSSTSDHNTLTNNTCSSNNYGIFLGASSGCTITNNTCSSNKYEGIRLSFSSNRNTLTNNNCSSNNDHGIHLDSSNDCTITNNTCSNNDRSGIHLSSSSDCTITNNTCNSNNWNGIALLGSSRCTITNNTCNSNNGESGISGGSYNIYSNNTCLNNGGSGISGGWYNIYSNNTCLNNGESGISGGSYNIYSNNTCSANNDHGIYLYRSRYCIITNNTMNENSISIFGDLESWNSHTIDTTNTVNGKPVYYYKNVTGFTLPYGAGQVILANCSWINVENQNCSNGSVGILVGYSSNITFENNTCNSNNDDGIYLWDSSNCTIENNTCENNNGGIALYDSSGCTITNNTCENNYGGIYLRDSSNCTIENNTCENNNFGIWLDSSSDCTLENNTCENNRCGIYLDSSSDCTLESNTCENNNGNGIRLYRSSDCTIENNTISENRVGIYKSSSSQHTTAHYNNIYNNTEYGIAAFYDTINATNNWWGAASGPYHPTENPEGEGDNITDYVLFDPWLVEEVNWPPEAHIDSISPDPAVEGERILLVGHGTDDGSIIGYAWRSSLDGEFYNGTDSEIKYDELSNGTHTIYFKVQDNHGIWSDEVSDTLTVNGKPRAHIDSISPEAAVVWQTVSFKGCGTDDGSIERYIWRTDEKDLYNGTNSSFTLSTLSVGNHTIYLKVQDNYGIWSDEVNTTLTINAPPNKIPTITIASPKDGDKVSGTVTIKGTASDEDGTVEKVEVSINSGGWTKVTGTTGWSYEWDTTKIKNGEYEIKLRAFDGEDYSDEVVWKLTVENKKDDDKGFIPGFAFMALVIGLAVAVYLKKVK